MGKPRLLSTCTACIPTTKATLSTSPQSKLWGGWANTECAILSTWLLTVSSTMGTLSVPANRTQISSQSVPIQRNPSIFNTSFPYFLISNLPVPFHLEKTISNCPFWSFLTPNMADKQMYHSNYAHLEDFPSPLTVLQTPERSWGGHCAARGGF